MVSSDPSSGSPPAAESLERQADAPALERALLAYGNFVFRHRNYLVPATIALIALIRRFLSPSGIPIFSKSTSVNSASTSLSIAFATNAGSYCPNPRFRSQLPTSMVEP